MKPTKKNKKQARDLSSDDENEQVRHHQKKAKRARVDPRSEDDNRSVNGQSDNETPTKRTKKRTKKCQTNDGTPQTYVQEKAAYGKRVCALARIAVNDVSNMCGLCYMTSLRMFKRTTR